MASRASDAVRGYTDVASGLLERWSALASRSASKMDAGGYDASSALEDTAAGAVLAAEAGWRWTAWWWESFARLGGFEGEEKLVESQSFHAPAGARLELGRALAKGRGLDELPPGSITIHPEQLEPGKTEFTLRAEGIACRGATYVGEVKATTDKGTDPVWVWISIQ